MDSNTIMSLLLFVSGCVVLYQAYRWNNIESYMEKDINKLLDGKWDDAYKQIIDLYGSTENFIDAHYADYDIFRSNVLIYIERLKKLRDGLNKTFDYLSRDIDKDCNTETVEIKLNAVRSNVLSALDSLIEDTEKFVKGEEEAHSLSRRVDVVLENLSKEIKDINFYDEKKD